MGRKVAYWVCTLIPMAMMILSAAMYLSGTQKAVEGFAHVGYPQQLRVILGIFKLAGAIVLIAPGLRLIKEWAYAGFGYAWICATIAHKLAGDPTSKVLTPIVLLVLLIVSYATRPANRRLVGAAVSS